MFIKNKNLKMNLQLFSENSEDLGFEDENIPEDDLGFDDEESFENEEENLEPGETEEEISEETSEVQTEETSTPEEQKIKIKYNKQDMELSLEQVQELAQKGMNYDKQVERLEQLQNNPGLNYLQSLAAKNDMTVEQLVDYWKQQEEQAELQALVQQNIPEEYAKEMIENRKFREQQQKLLDEQKVQKEQEDTMKSDLSEFVETFGQIEPKDIPQEVWENTNNGKSLTQAYMEYDYKRVQQENKILKQNKSNKAKAPGITSNSAYGSADADTESDAFLDGFNSI